MENTITNKKLWSEANEIDVINSELEYNQCSLKALIDYINNEIISTEMEESEKPIHALITLEKIKPFCFMLSDYIDKCIDINDKLFKTSEKLFDMAHNK